MRHLMVTIAAAVLYAAGLARAEAAPIEMTDGLAIGVPGARRGGRTAIPVDPIAAMIARGQDVALGFLRIGVSA